MPEQSASQLVAGAAAGSRNEVVLVGRLAAVPELRTLPSGDVLASFRLVVGRPPGVSGRPARMVPARTATVDTLDCVTWRAKVRRAAVGWEPGDVVEVSGSLRRRFWRAGAGTASRCEVEVAGARRLHRAGAKRPSRPAAAAADRSGASG